MDNYLLWNRAKFRAAKPLVVAKIVRFLGMSASNVLA